MASETGGRYICATCASEFLVVRKGSTDLRVSCCGTPLQPKNRGTTGSTTPGTTPGTAASAASGPSGPSAAGGPA